MAIVKPVIQEITSNEVLRDASRPKLNQNYEALKSALDADIDALNGQSTSSNTKYVQVWNGSSYPPRPSASAVPNGLVERVGPVPPSDNLSRDQWIETDS